MIDSFWSTESDRDLRCQFETARKMIKLTPALFPTQLTGVPFAGSVPQNAPGQFEAELHCPGAPFEHPPV
jgi:hypothetical protein